MGHTGIQELCSDGGNVSTCQPFRGEVIFGFLVAFPAQVHVPVIPLGEISLFLRNGNKLIFSKNESPKVVN